MSRNLAKAKKVSIWHLTGLIVAFFMILLIDVEGTQVLRNKYWEIALNSLLVIVLPRNLL